MDKNTTLDRKITLTGLIFYGTGTMIGGGIYALLGKVTAESGTFAPWSMLFAGLLALITALTFAELATRYPKSGGSAFYISQAFQSRLLGGLSGWLIIATGVVSAATLTVAASQFLFELFSLPLFVGQLVVAVILCLIASWGINQSVITVAIVTLIEIAGLIFVIAYNRELLTQGSQFFEDLLPTSNQAIWIGIFSGSVLAFYAFIGFEDMVTLAEEVKQVRKNLPIGIIVSIMITIALYILISLVAVQSSDFSSLGESHSPMAALVKDNQILSPTVLVIISLLAGFNGALVQVVMASRMLYGMAGEKQAPAVFSKINNKTKTPIYATLFAAIIVLILAWTMNLTTLAKLTSGIILLVFTAVNLALCKLKISKVTTSHFSLPLILPIAGSIFSLMLFAFAIWSGISH